MANAPIFEKNVTLKKKKNQNNKEQHPYLK
jgi:hypothetical protein